MHSFEIRRVRSSIEEDFACVSIWFRAGSRRLEPLHFVCQKGNYQASRRSPFDALYLERDDQGIACYDGAKRVQVGDEGIEIQLKPNGVKALGFDRAVAFNVPAELAGWKKAKQVFREMAGYSSGQAIEIAEQGAVDVTMNVKARLGDDGR